MNVGVIPIGITSVDWTTLTSFAKKILNRSVTNGLERDNLTIGPLTSYFSILGEMKLPGLRAIDYLSDPGNLVHAHASFMILCDVDVMLEILESSHVKGMVVNDYLLIASATFDNWIIAFTKKYRIEDTQKAMNLILAHFEKIGMGSMFRDYKRTVVHSSSFKLELK